MAKTAQGFRFTMWFFLFRFLVTWFLSVSNNILSLVRRPYVPCLPRMHLISSAFCYRFRFTRRAPYCLPSPHPVYLHSTVGQVSAKTWLSMCQILICYGILDNLRIPYHSVVPNSFVTFVTYYHHHTIRHVVQLSCTDRKPGQTDRSVWLYSLLSKLFSSSSVS